LFPFSRGSGLILNRSLSSGQSRDRYTEGGTTHVSQSDSMAELHGIRIATVFAADPQFDIRARASSLLDRNFHELPDARLVDSRERVLLDDFQFGIRREERSRIVATHPKTHLCKIVRPETKELGALSDLIRRQGTPWNFNHRTDHVIELRLLFGHDFFRHAMDDFDLKIEFLLKADQRNHDLRPRLDPGRLDFGRRLEGSARLHL